MADPTNPYLDTLRSTSIATGAPQDENPYLGLLQDTESVRRTQMSANVSQALTVSPDQYSAQRRVANYLGYPPAVVEAMPDIAKQQAQLRQIQEATAGSPALQQKYTDADFAKLAHDDAGALAKVGGWFADAAKYVVSAPDAQNTLAGDLGAGVADTSRGAAGLFRGVAELPAPLLDFMEATTPQEMAGWRGAVGGNPLRRLAEGFDTLGAQNKATADQLSPTQPGMMGAVSSGVRSLAQNTLMLPMAFAPGGQGAAITALSSVTGGQAYQQAREQGLSPVQALPFAVSQAAIEYATEKLPLEKLIGDVKTSAPVWQMLAHQAALEVPGEQIATALQDMNEWAVLPENKDKPFSAYLAERPNAALQTLVATLISTGGNVMLSKAIDGTLRELDGRANAAQAAADDSQRVQQLMALAGESKLRERSPEHFAEAVQALAEESGVAPTEVRFDARTLADALNQAGVDQAQIGALLPSVPVQLQEAITTGGEVTVPIGEFTALAGSPLEQTLMQHARIGENELSQAEAKTVGEEATQMLQEHGQRLNQLAVETAQIKAGGEQVKQQVLDQLNATKRFTADVNDAYATLAGEFYTTMAGRLKVAPEQLYARYPLKVQAVGVQGEKLNQAQPSRGAAAQDLAPLEGQRVNVLADGTQPLRQGARGAYSPSTLTISLLESADLSTFLHEMGHFFLEATIDVASQPNAPADVVKDVDALLSWFGVKDLATWQAMTLDQKRKHHERFAESFEQYLLEGKAPSQQLQPLFQRFRAWLVNVYRGLTEFMTGRNLQLSDEVRGVFDRLLAAQDQIDQMQTLRAQAPLFKSAKDAGMSPEQWAAYQAQGQAAADAAVDTLQARSIRDMRWTTGARSRALKALQKDVEGKRKAIEAEVRAEVEKEPIRQAMHWLRKGEMTSPEGELIKAEKGFRLNTTALAEMYPDSALGNPDLAKLKGMTAANGLHPDVVAAMFGFGSGDELVRAIADAEPMASVVEGLTDRRLLERFGDLATPQGVQRAADEAVHNEARGRFVATELKALRDAMGQTERTARGGSVNVMVRAAKQFADQLVGQRKVRELKPGQHVAAETRAARAAERALAKKDTQGAIVAKRDQLLNHYAARATNEAMAEVERGVDYLKKFDKESIRKKLPAEYLDQIDKLLERVDLRQATNAALDKRAKLSAWIDSQREIGIEPDIPAGLLEDVQLTSYRDMPVEQFRGLIDTVRQVEHLGRLKSKLLTAKDQREYEAIRDDIVQSILANAGNRSANTRSPTTKGGEALAMVRALGAAHVKVATWARIMDGGKDGGPVWEYFVRSANEAGDMETTMRAKATEDLAKLLAPILKKGGLASKRTLYPSIKTGLTRESVIAIALNTGNESNLQRLLGGEGWTQAQIEPVLDTLTPEEWSVVQGIWDYFAGLKPQIDAMEQRVYGRSLAKIPPGSPLTEKYGVKGGYYPVVYDPAASQRAEEHADAEGAKRQLQGAYGAASVRRGFTKARAEEVNGRPLLYTLQGVYRGVNEQIHYLSWAEWLIDVNRLMRSKSIDTAMREKYGPDVVRQFKSWRDDIAEGDSAPQHVADRWLGFVRRHVSVAGLAFNVMSALMQPLGLAQSIQRVGLPWVAKGIMRTIGSPRDASKAVNEKSSFMANRARTRFRELNELRNQVKGQNAVTRAIDQNAYRLMMAFQRLVDVPTWQGAYEKAIAEGQTEKRAIALADQAVIDSQGGGQTKDLAAIERGSQGLKLFTVFYSFMNTALNLGVASKMTPRSRAKFAADMVLLYVVPAVFGKILKDALTPGDADDEELAKKLAAEQLSYLLGLVVIGREMAQLSNTITGAGQAHDYAGPAGLRAIVDAYQFGKQALQGEFDDAFRKAAVNLAGDAFGLPSAQINRTITGVNALNEGKTSNPAAAVLGYQGQ